MANSNLTAQEHRFLEEFAALVAGWNMPNTVARVYGYLLLQTEPAGLDEIAAALNISKSNACTAAKVLENAGHCRRVAERGSKRVRYVAREDFGTPFLLRTASLGTLGKLMTANAGSVAKGAAAERLELLAGFYETMQLSMEEVIWADTSRSTKQA